MELNNMLTLASLLNKNSSPEATAYVESRLQDMGLELSDLYRALEMTSPTVEFLRDEGSVMPISQLHAHPFYEVMFCGSNCGAEYLVGAQRYLLQRGDIILIPPGVSHAPLVRTNSGEAYQGCLLWVSRAFVEQLQQAFPYFREFHTLPGIQLRTGGTVWDFLEDLFRTAITESELRTPGWEAILTGLAIQILTHISRAVEDSAVPSATSKNPDTLDQILAYVETNLSKKITIEDIVNRFWISSGTIAHLFKNRLGISFYKYVTQRRLTTAKNLIREGMPMEKIAAKVGFGDYSAFYRAFKQECGMSLRQFSNLVALGKAQETPQEMQPLP